MVWLATLSNLFYNSTTKIRYVIVVVGEVFSIFAGTWNKRQTSGFVGGSVVKYVCLLEGINIGEISQKRMVVVEECFSRSGVRSKKSFFGRRTKH